MKYNDFWNVEEWHILDTKTCCFFDENETAFEAVNVQVGILTVYQDNMVVSKYPITRWIPVKEFRRLKKSRGVVVF